MMMLHLGLEKSRIEEENVYDRANFSSILPYLSSHLSFPLLKLSTERCEVAMAAAERISFIALLCIEESSEKKVG